MKNCPCKRQSKILLACCEVYPISEQGASFRTHLRDSHFCISIGVVQVILANRSIRISCNVHWRASDLRAAINNSSPIFLDLLLLHIHPLQVAFFVQRFRNRKSILEPSGLKSHHLYLVFVANLAYFERQGWVLYNTDFIFMIEQIHCLTIQQKNMHNNFSLSEVWIARFLKQMWCFS